MVPPAATVKFPDAVPSVVADACPAPKVKVTEPALFTIPDPPTVPEAVKVIAALAVRFGANTIFPLLVLSDKLPLAAPPIAYCLIW